MAALIGSVLAYAMMSANEGANKVKEECESRGGRLVVSGGAGAAPERVNDSETVAFCI
jgi:hypothetical protein